MTDACDYIKDGDIIVRKLSEDAVLVFREYQFVELYSDRTLMVWDFMPDVEAITIIGNGYYFEITSEMYDRYRKAYDVMNGEEEEE